MPTIKLEHSIITKIQKMNNIKHDKNIWDTWLPKIGCPVEKNNSENIEIEVFPDRPDLLSHETMAKACRSFLGLKKESSEIKVNDGVNKLSIEQGMDNIRPIIVSAIVRGVSTGDSLDEKEKFIQTLMDHQEKLHLTLGRKRKFASIGVHDMNNIKGPFRYTKVTKDYKFVPLAGSKEMSISDIILKNPKGIEYSHLVKKLSEYPVILDSRDNVISFPPIINGQQTTVTYDTKDFFIDVTGWDRRACETCLMLICLSLEERGGEIESVEITNSENEVINTPNGKAILHRVPHNLINKILGFELSDYDISSSIVKMGGELIESRTVTDGPNVTERWSDCVIGEKEHIILMPRWRSDIIHPIDIVEDIAIGYGYDNLPEDASSIHLDALPLESAQRKRRIRESLRALGLQEIQSLTLSNERDQFERMRMKKIGNVTHISNPISIEHTILRQYVTPSLMQLLAANRHQELPQRIYELGHVVINGKNKYNFAWACAEVGGGFTEAKGYTQALMRDLGINLEDVHFKPMEQNNGPWLFGRGCRVLVQDIEIGQFGEIDPLVSFEFGLKSPIHAGEFDIDKIRKISKDPLV